MIDMLKRHAVQVLRKAGHTLEETAKLGGVSVRSVQRIEDEPAVVQLEGEEERRRNVGRPSKAKPFRGFVTDLLREEPELLSVEVLRRARLKGYEGAKSALYGLVRLVRPVPVRPLVRFEGLPGEFTQHDFGEVDVRFLDGTRKRVHFFASRLKYSRWVEVSLVEDERVENLVRSMVSHFESMGGIPLLAVFDRPKTVALKWRHSGDVTDWNPTFAAVAFELGLGIELCWPHSPEQKGSVENLVGWVKGSFFKQRRFLDHADLLSQLQEWLVEVNTLRPSRATREIPSARIEQERARLRPLRVQSADLALRVPVITGVTGYVLHDDHLYSMDPEAIGVAGTLYLYQDRVRIVAGRHEALHPRLREPRAKSTLPQHRARSVAAVSGKRGKRYLQREHLLELGQVALDYLTELTHRRPRIWIRDVERLHELLLTHGDEAVRAALGRGLEAQAYGAEYIAHFLGEDHKAPSIRAQERQQEIAL